jgi:hypothetical protein
MENGVWVRFLKLGQIKLMMSLDCSYIRIVGFYNWRIRTGYEGRINHCHLGDFNRLYLFITENMINTVQSSSDKTSSNQKRLSEQWTHLKYIRNRTIWTSAVGVAFPQEAFFLRDDLSLHIGLLRVLKRSWSGKTFLTNQLLTLRVCY